MLSSIFQLLKDRDTKHTFISILYTMPISLPCTEAPLKAVCTLAKHSA